MSVWARLDLLDLGGILKCCGPTVFPMRYGWHQVGSAGNMCNQLCAYQCMPFCTIVDHLLPLCTDPRYQHLSKIIPGKWRVALLESIEQRIIKSITCLHAFPYLYSSANRMYIHRYYITTRNVWESRWFVKSNSISVSNHTMAAYHTDTWG